MDEDHLAVGVRHAERQDLRHQRPDLARRKVDHRRHLPADELFELETSNYRCFREVEASWRMFAA
jgi:hypothetical protein